MAWISEFSYRFYRGGTSWAAATPTPKALSPKTKDPRPKVLIRTAGPLKDRLSWRVALGRNTPVDQRPAAQDLLGRMSGDPLSTLRTAESSSSASARRIPPDQ